MSLKSTRKQGKEVWDRYWKRGEVSERFKHERQKRRKRNREYKHLARRAERRMNQRKDDEE